MDAPHFNFLAIVTAALVTFAVGGLWDSPILFARPWMRECGLTEEQTRRAPLARVPENSMKFAVGVLLSSFGAFWGAEGAGASWPGHVASGNA